ncbi:DUF806 family protein [Lapidilactobacillus wuchangensis]|uniref:DUF806 family protein n=1 Tax=Lapidilactobacillus wuchangensis TaxID=2486001 RepID=UPI000F79D1D5|nr:DUF806 family protein [Lapidilactobacillus wuchangensis]
MTAVMDATNLLKSASVNDIDGVYPNLLSADIQADTSKTVILVTDVNERYGSFGSNRSTTKDSTIALNIFYGINSNASRDTVEETIVSLFEDNDWRIIYSPGQTIDPDTQQITKIMQFSKTKGR